MSKYHGFEVKEEYEGQLEGVLGDSVDPLLIPAIAQGLELLGKMNPRGAEKKLEAWANILQVVVDNATADTRNKLASLRAATAVAKAESLSASSSSEMASKESRNK